MLTNGLSEWSQMTFHVPSKAIFEPTEFTEEIEESLDEAKWYFYRYPNVQCSSWPGLLATSNREKSKLLEIIHCNSTMYNQEGPRLSAQDVLRQYGKLMTWRNELPDVLGNIESNTSQALPHVLSLL